MDNEIMTMERGLNGCLLVLSRVYAVYCRSIITAVVSPRREELTDVPSTLGYCGQKKIALAQNLAWANHFHVAVSMASIRRHRHTAPGN
jgi:hypothetical protein